MSLVLDDQAIRDAEVFLELAMKFGHDVYAAASDALKQAHPKLVAAVLPPEESGAIAKEADALIDAKFGHDTDPALTRPLDPSTSIAVRGSKAGS